MIKVFTTNKNGKVELTKQELQKLLDDIGLNSNVPIDYIKSSPYILSFCP